MTAAHLTGSSSTVFSVVVVNVIMPCFVFVYLFAGWKLNPVVGAVYSPEFYAGKEFTIAWCLWALLEMCFAC